MTERLINTSKERGINEEKINNGIPEDEEDIVGVEEKTPTSVEEKNIETPQELLDSKKEIKLDEMTQPEIENKYLEILTKMQKKEKVSKEETIFKTKVDEAIAKGEELRQMEYQKRLLAEKEEELSKREEFLKEYIQVKKDNPDSIVKAKQDEISLTGGSSIPKALKFFLQMRKAKKKGGKVLVKVFRDKRVTIEWTNKPDLTYVEFYTKDEHGNELVEITRFNEFIHTYEGTPIPVLFAIQGVANGYNFFEQVQKDITSEMVSRLTSRAYHAGYQKGAELVNPNNKKNDLLALLTQFMPLILIIGLIAILYLLNQNYQSMQAVYNAVQALQGQIVANPGIIKDMNTVILR